MANGQGLPPNPPRTPLEQAEAQIAAHNAEAVSQLHWWSSAATWSALFQTAEGVSHQFVNTLIAGIADDQLENLIKVVKERREKVPLRTGITDQILSICQQTLTFGAAGLALAVGFLDKIRAFPVIIQKFIAVGGIFYLEMVLVSFLVLAWYMLQAHFRYPFLYLQRIGNAWPWFYYASVREVARRPLQFAVARFSAAESYAVDFMKFANRALTETKRERMRAELQQYFLLMAYSGYIQQFSLRLTNLFTYGFTGAVLSALVFLFGVAKGVI